MTRHPFDVLAFVLGVVSLALGVAAIAGELGPLANTPASLVALAVALVGVVLIASSVRRRSVPSSSVGDPQG
jgi:hypothetical protein